MKRKILVVLCVLSLCFAAGVFAVAFAEDEAAATDTATEEASSETTATDWKETISGQVETMRSNAEAARSEEVSLKQQIDEAMKSGDYETAKSLRDQLHTTHQENIAQQKEDISTMQGYKQEAISGQGQMNPSGERQRSMDKMEDKRDRREDKMDRREDFRDKQGSGGGQQGRGRGPGMATEMGQGNAYGRGPGGSKGPRGEDETQE